MDIDITTLIIIAGTWVAKSLIDLGVKHSKTTENTFDDWLFGLLKDTLKTIKKK